MRGIETAPHEFDANLNFVEWGLDPIFACDHVIKQADGQRIREFTSSGEQWVATLRYQESNIVHPGEQTPTGTEWQLQPDTDTDPNTIKRSYRIEIERAEDEDQYNQQGFVGHIRPRWSGMEGVSKDGSTHEIAVPDEFGEGINIKVQGSNVKFERYPELLRDGMNAVDVSPRYADQLHESSNIQDAERYVRIHRDESGPVHARDGPIANLGHLLENDREGYRKIIQQDHDGRRNPSPGYYHTVTLGPMRISKAWPGHELPKEIKHYNAREGDNLPESHPMAHPKVGASYQVSRWDETLYWDALDQLNDELQETVHSVLQDAGIVLHSEAPYVEGEYFSNEIIEIEPPTELSISQIRQEQESVVVRHLADGLSPVQWDALSDLVTDGGEVSPDDIAESGGWHVESVRRALRQMDDLVERKYAEVGLRSDYVAEMVHDAVQQAEQAVTSAVETAANAMDSAERAVDQSMSAWLAWCDKHDVDVTDRREAMRLDFGQEVHGKLSVKLMNARQLWREAGQDLRRLRNAEVIVGGRRRGRVRDLSMEPPTLR